MDLSIFKKVMRQPAGSKLYVRITHNDKVRIHRKILESMNGDYFSIAFNEEVCKKEPYKGKRKRELILLCEEPNADGLYSYKIPTYEKSAPEVASLLRACGIPLTATYTMTYFEELNVWVGELTPPKVKSKTKNQIKAVKTVAPSVEDLII